MQDYDITIKVRTVEGNKSHKRTSSRSFKEVVDAKDIGECMENMTKMIQKFVDETKSDQNSLPELPFDESKEETPETEQPTGT